MWGRPILLLSFATPASTRMVGNRISIGVVSEANVARAEQELEALDIPLEAAEIEVIGGISYD